MATVRRKRPAPTDVILELQIRGGRVLASLKPPDHCGPGAALSEVPIDQAVVAGIKLASENGGDVAVIDPYELWPE